MMAGLGNMLGMGGGPPNPEMLRQMAAKMPNLPNSLPPGLSPSGGLPGLGSTLPGLGGKDLKKK
jgi:hypothetical protein